jgi:hypothetical protein
MSLIRGRERGMKKVTAISEGKRGKRVNVFLDGKFAFSLEAEVAVREGLGVGQELSEGDALTLPSITSATDRGARLS